MRYPCQLHGSLEVVPLLYYGCKPDWGMLFWPGIGLPSRHGGLLFPLLSVLPVKSMSPETKRDRMLKSPLPYVAVALSLS